MALPPLVKQLADKLFREFCERRVSPAIRDKVRLEYEIRGSTVTLWECRPYWRDPSETWIKSKVAQARYHPKTGWLLFWSDRNGKWLTYEPLPCSRNVHRIMAEIEEDPYAMFWG